MKLAFQNSAIRVKSVTRALVSLCVAPLPVIMGTKWQYCCANWMLKILYRTLVRLWVKPCAVAKRVDRAKQLRRVNKACNIERSFIHCKILVLNWKYEIYVTVCLLNPIPFQLLQLFFKIYTYTTLDWGGIPWLHINIPVGGRGGQQSCQSSRLPHFVDNRLKDRGDVSLTGSPAAPYPKEDSWY
jgi:hypothetical protein